MKVLYITECFIYKFYIRKPKVNMLETELLRKLVKEGTIYLYKEGKETEISKLNAELDKFKKMVEESQSIYENMLEKTTQSLEEIIKNTETGSKVQ